MYVYDYPNCESDEDLADKAIEEFKKEHVKVEEITLNVIDAKVELNLGDIIGGTDEITGLHIETEITQKILTITIWIIIYIHTRIRATQSTIMKWSAHDISILTLYVTYQ